MRKILTKLSKRVGALAVISALVASSLNFVGCDSASASENGTKKIVVGIASATEDMAYYNEAGELDGFEYQLLVAIDDLLDDYTFEYNTSDFSNILIQLDTNAIDIGVHQFEYSDARAAKYVYGTEGYLEYNTYLIVPTDSEYTSIEDLAGKVYGGYQNDATTAVIEKYNEENPDKALVIDYAGSLSSEILVESFLQGVWDVRHGTQRTVDKYNAEYGNGEEIFKIIGDVLNSTEAYLLYPSGTDEEFVAEVDEAIRTLKSNGTLKKLSEEYLGGDYIPDLD